MTERSRALLILKQAREILLQRLTEHVLENEEELLSDARGESYMGEIDSLYEQIGTPLVHLNQILSNLPIDDETHAHDAHGVHPAPHSYAEIVPPAWPEVPALPAPRGSGAVEAIVEEVVSPISFQTFAAQVQADDLEGAGRSRAALFDLPLERATGCAHFFRQQMRDDPEFLVKAMQLRRELSSGGYNAAAQLLYQCFGLTGSESVGVVQVLKARFQS